MKKFTFGAVAPVLTVLAVMTLLVVVAGMFSGCGYRLSGFGNQLPDYIRTIAIPDFENKTSRYQADQFVTFAVRDEFIKRSKLRLVENMNRADALLEGKINTFTIRPQSYGPDASANLYRISISVSVRLIDLKSSEVIYEGSNISFNDTFDISVYGDEGATALDSEDFFSQETETVMKIAEEFASSVVTSILENF